MVSAQNNLLLRALVALAVAATATTTQAHRGTTTRVSVSSMGVQANSGSFSTSVSADGQSVAFTSAASNLVPDDTNSTWDVFVHDRHTGKTTRVSVSSTGKQGNDMSMSPSISADGRFVAFESLASNLVPNDTNGRDDVFVRDLETGQTTRVSVSSTGKQGNDMSMSPSISADGRFVAFESLASNLVPNDTNAVWDVFVHDRQTGQTTRVSVSSSGQQGYFSSFHASISADGRFVAFTSYSPDLAPRSELRNMATWSHVFVHDRRTGETTRVSVSSSGHEGNRDSGLSSISADGRFVAFQSQAFNLVPNDTNETWDIFVHDRLTGLTTRVSVSSAGQEAMGRSVFPSISADGRFVGFESNAPNLVPNDTNGAWDAFVHQYGSHEGWLAGTIAALCRQ